MPGLPLGSHQVRWRRRKEDSKGIQYGILLRVLRLRLYNESTALVLPREKKQTGPKAYRGTRRSARGRRRGSAQADEIAATREARAGASDVSHEGGGWDLVAKHGLWAVDGKVKSINK